MVLSELEIRLLIAGGETNQVELKVASPRPSEMAERLCGMANARGGVIIIGVEDTTLDIVEVPGERMALTKDVILRATRQIIKPSLVLEPPEPEVCVVDGKQLVVATVLPGNGPLYQAGGVCWIRHGTHTVPLEVSEIEAFLYRRGTLIWETQPVLQVTLEDLDMTLVEAFLERRLHRSKAAGRLPHPKEILLNIGCAVAIEDKREQQVIRPTNAGMLLFGHRPQQFILQAEVACLLYRDNLGMKRYAERRILHGTIAQQIDQAEEFFKDFVSASGYMEDFHRHDELDCILNALREAVVNAVVHRDYSLRGEAVRIFCYPNSVDIHSPGLLLPGITLTDLQSGKLRSKLRNPIIGTILRDFPGGYMELVGSGVSYMIDQMRKLGCPEPQFREQGEIIVVFPDVPSSTESPFLTELSSFHGKRQDFIKEERQLLALCYVHEHGSITNKEYRAITGASENTALRDLDDLVERASLRGLGKRRARHYKLP